MSDMCLLKNLGEKHMKDVQYQKVYRIQLFFNKGFFNAVLNIGTLTLFLIFSGIEFQSFGHW